MIPTNKASGAQSESGHRLPALCQLVPKCLLTAVVTAILSSLLSS